MKMMDDNDESVLYKKILLLNMFMQYKNEIIIHTDTLHALHIHIHI